MKSVLLSIRPQWVQKILSGEKTIEVRRTAPTFGDGGKPPQYLPPFKCYIYCTKGNQTVSYASYCGFDMEDYSKDFTANGTVVAEFTCNKVEGFSSSFRTDALERISTASCLRIIQLEDYEFYPKRATCLYAWHISDLKIYDTPMSINEFFVIRNIPVKYAYGTAKQRYTLERPPQSWCYVEESK